MSKNITLEAKQGEQHDHKAMQLLMQYVVTLGICIGGLVILVVLSKLVLSTRIWYQTDPYWPMLHWLNLHVISVCVAASGAICLIVTIYYLFRAFRQMDEVVEAAGKLVHQPEQPLRLSRSLQGVQNELNLVREQALRNEMAVKEAEQKKNDLIVYLAHDLKTPLTSVIGYLSLLRDEPQISEQLRQRYTGIALNKAERLEELINEFFDITRFNLSVMTLEKETIHLSRMLEQIASEFAPILQEKGLTLELAIEKEVDLSGDPDKLERVFDNLLRNAVNYSYPNTVIQLSMEQRKEEHKVLLRVQNHGRTIAKEKLEHMNQILSDLYVRDSVTGLYNRMGYQKLSISYFTIMREKKMPVLVMFIDLDRLKYINDTFGHEYGDFAIVSIAKAMLKHCDADAIAARTGGDEFIVLEGAKDEESGRVLAQKIRTELSKAQRSMQLPFDLSASIGAVVAHPGEENVLESYVKRAEMLMYEEKAEKKVSRDS